MMSNKVLILLVVLVLVTSQGTNQKRGRGSGQCPPFHETVDDKCLLSCTHSSFENCPDSFPFTRRFKVCAHLLDGSTITYDFNCQACENPDVIGLQFGQCGEEKIRENGENGNRRLPKNKEVDELCADVECPDEEVCKRGNCVAKREKRCKPWETEVDGECVDECVDVECSEGQICLQGECVVDECANLECPEGEKCILGACREVKRRRRGGRGRIGKP